LKAVLTILFGALLVLAQSLTSNAVPTASGCACSCARKCCVRSAPAPGVPDSQSAPASVLRAAQFTLPAHQQPARLLSAPVSLLSFPASVFCPGVVPLNERTCTWLI
jgi:hypothetical protein